MCARWCRGICAARWAGTADDAAIAGLGMTLPAIHRHAMAAGGETSGKLLGEGLKSAVAGGNAARAENREPHGAGPSRAYRAPPVLASARAVGPAAGRLTGS